MLFAYFNESMGISGGMNHGEVGIQYMLHQYEFRMSSQQYLSGNLLYYTNGAYEFSVEFCVVKFFKFWVKFRWNTE